jgi:titin
MAFRTHQTNLRSPNRFIHDIDLRWDDNASDEDGVNIAISTDGINFNHLDSVGRDIVDYRASGLHHNTPYWFEVRAYNAYGFSAYSNVIQVTTKNEAPEAPANLRDDNVGKFYVDLKWDDMSDNELSFNIAISTDGVNFNKKGEVGENVTSFRADNLNANTDYWFKVRAVNDFDNDGKDDFSEYSNVLKIRTKR